MIKSMTGFGKAVCECQNRKMVIEIKSLNSKSLDINARIPNGYREKEVEIRNLISSRLHRGKVDFQIIIENSGEASNFSINKSLAQKYYRELKELSQDFNEKDFERVGAFIENNPIYFSGFTILTPFPGTEQWDILKGQIVIDDLDYYNLTNAVIKTRLPEKEFYPAHHDNHKLRVARPSLS